ncbi:MAG: hypothetical protein JWM72_3668 [Actinomycetia bacterium]|jgi:hypothetical protein|nr:hypothetical protein [Actinomycetes bacterium]MDQ1458758.1 hypothetical protein [Actinomycetota bacterium]
MEHFPDNSPRLNLAVGTSIEVRGHFRGDWSRGFEVAEAAHDGYWVRRLSDRYVLPVEFSGHDVRRET